MGLPRTARRIRNGKDAPSLRQTGNRNVRNRQIQRGVPRHRPPLHQRMGTDRQTHGPLGGLQKRIPHDGPQLHGIHLVGLQTALGSGTDLRRAQDPPLLRPLRHAALQFRGQPGISGGGRPRHHNPLQSGRGGKHLLPRMDHNAVDAAVQHGARIRTGDRLRQSQ